jgi:hypothetical protein
MKDDKIYELELKLQKLKAWKLWYTITILLFTFIYMPYKIYFYYKSFIKISKSLISPHYISNAQTYHYFILKYFTLDPENLFNDYSLLKI